MRTYAKDVCKTDNPKIAKNRPLQKIYVYIDLRIHKNIIQIGEAKVLKSKFMHTLLELKSIFAIEKKTIV